MSEHDESLNQVVKGIWFLLVLVTIAVLVMVWAYHHENHNPSYQKAGIPTVAAKPAGWDIDCYTGGGFIFHFHSDSSGMYDTGAWSFTDTLTHKHVTTNLRCIEKH